MITTINPGEQIDHYRIDTFAASGATAAIFRGTDLRTNQQVALKIPHQEIQSDPTLFERFQREVEVGKMLDHPGLLKMVTDHERSGNYVVTEWFEGKSLRHILSEQKKLPADRALRIAIGLCEVLNYIHNHGIVHRNLKPENILVGKGDQIKLINFGVASKAWSRRITFTNLSQVVGMSEYISPEEANGKRGNERSDIYSFGVVLYEMLTGRLPFPSGPFDRTVKDPIPPREIDPSITPQMQEVILHAMERDPRDRYASAHVIELDLTNINRVKIHDRHKWRGDKVRGFPQRKLALYISLVFIPIVIFGLLMYFARH
jgi:eukaryotic-like serine/threonine-protein kinase